ncbi:MAG: D-TA family PLP-dependent enzyme, partial [Planctomycetota bacterium]
RAILDVAGAIGPRLRGVHAYEGHLHGPFPERGAALDRVFAELAALLDGLAQSGVPVDEVVTSGTPAFRHVLERDPLAGAAGSPVHRVSPGTVVLHDLRSELENPELGLEPAAVVLARVVSLPGRARVTVDAGSKAIAAEAGDPVAVVLGRPDLVGAPCNEEHLPLDALGEGTLPEIGSLLELVPRHVCPTVNLHEVALGLDGDAWREIEIVARAHAPLPTSS